MSEFSSEVLRAMIDRYQTPVMRMPNIIESTGVQIIHVRVRGVPAAHKPNRNRPYYRRIKTIEYPIYYIKSQGVYVCHPLMAVRLREKFKAEMRNESIVSNTGLYV